MMLAQLGADVILIEDPARPGPLDFSRRTYNRGKRSILLDLAGSDADRATFHELVAGADIVFTTDDRATLRERGMAPEQLEALNPGLVHVSITAFGLDGPKADYHATDLVALAAGGLLKITGDQ
ncbi:MAG TPA: CoA transferase, partial [Ilumatobacteraceae bacterium]|nr:CoA transferase [Ilumatobacteraceae bacterium]